MGSKVTARLGHYWHELSGEGTTCGRPVPAEIQKEAVNASVPFPVLADPPDASMGRPRNCGWCRHGIEPPTPPARLVGWCTRCAMWQRIDETMPASPCLNESCNAEASEIRNMTELMQRVGRIEWMTLANERRVFPAPADIEQHEAGYDSRERFDTSEVLDVGEDSSLHSATGEGSFWIVRDSGGISSFLDEDEARGGNLIKLERYEERATWQTVVRHEVEKAKRRGRNYERRVEVWRDFEKRTSS